MVGDPALPIGHLGYILLTEVSHEKIPWDTYQSSAAKDFSPSAAKTASFDALGVDLRRPRFCV